MNLKKVKLGIAPCPARVYNAIVMTNRPPPGYVFRSVFVRGRVRAWRNGRRARLRIWCLMAWEFKSLRPHQCGSSSVVECHLAKVDVASSNLVYRSICGCSSMVELQPSKLATWVRFPSPAPFVYGPLAQLVEHLTLNQGVRRSSRRWVTKNPHCPLGLWGFYFRRKAYQSVFDRHFDSRTSKNNHCKITKSGRKR